MRTKILGKFLSKALLLIAFLKVGYVVKAQGATLTKEETVNYINKKLEEVNQLSMDYAFNVRYKDEGTNNEHQKVNKMYVMNNRLTYESDDILVHSDKIASSLNRCYEMGRSIYGSKTTTIHFNPRHVTGIEVMSNDDSKIGTLKISFIPNTVRWDKSEFEFNIETETTRKKYSHNDFFGNPVYYDEYDSNWKCNDTYKSTTAPTSDALIVYFLKSDPTNANKLTKAFNHLVDLHKAEDDPFGD